jgi:hypothetical protein
MDIYILYRDLRTYGRRENLYKEARAKGVMFIRFDLENKPQVEQTADGDLTVTVGCLPYVLLQGMLPGASRPDEHGDGAPG